jgi:hypothetical protein
MERRRSTGVIPSWPCIAGVAEGPAIVAGSGDACGSRSSGRDRGDGDEMAVLTTAVGGSSRGCCASTRSARVWTVGGVAAAANLVSLAAGPHLPYIAQCDGAHQLRASWGAPDQGAGERRPIGPVGVRRSLGDQSNSLPLDLTLYFSFPFHLLFLVSS